MRAMTTTANDESGALCRVGLAPVEADDHGWRCKDMQKFAALFGEQMSQIFADSKVSRNRPETLSTTVNDRQRRYAAFQCLARSEARLPQQSSRCVKRSPHTDRQRRVVGSNGARRCRQCRAATLNRKQTDGSLNWVGHTSRGPNEQCLAWGAPQGACRSDLMSLFFGEEPVPEVSAHRGL
jgi:hypothetical protein